MTRLEEQEQEILRLLAISSALLDAAKAVVQGRPGQFPDLEAAIALAERP